MPPACLSLVIVKGSAHAADPQNTTNPKSWFFNVLVQEYAQTSYFDAPDAGKILPGIFEKHDS